MQLKIGEKNYNIKFAYKPTLKARVLSKTAKAQAKLNTITDEEDVDNKDDEFFFAL